MISNFKSIFIFIFLLVGSINLFASGETPKRQPIEGRWDLTVDLGDRLAASWLEVRLSGIQTLTGHFVADGGSARPISEVIFKDNKVSFHIPAQWEVTDKELIVEGVLKDGKLSHHDYPKGTNPYLGGCACTKFKKG